VEGAAKTANQSFENIHERGPRATQQEHELDGAPAVRFRLAPLSDEPPASEPTTEHLGVLRRWFFPDPATFRRTLIGIALTLAALGVGVGLTVLIEPDDPTTLYWLIAALGIGVYIRARTAVWASYVGLVIPIELFTVAQYLYLGGAEWERRNIEHWQGNVSPLFKLTGQLIELPMFGILFALLAGIGALVAYRIERDWIVQQREKKRRRGGRDSGGSQSPNS
jgi:hypothetical protein